MAINRADRTYFNKSLNEFASITQSAKSCIFISHKSEDADRAIKIGNYVRDVAKIDIYLDVSDAGLQGAVARGNDKLIVQYIEKGINTSTHMLCLISDSNAISWWVPYELGFAKKSNKGIASMKLNTADNLPSFLKIEKQIYSIVQFNEYLKSITDSTTSLNENYQYHPLKDNLDPYSRS